MKLNFSTPRERLESLLKIHKGTCFVPESAADFIGFLEAANEMESEGKVSVENSTVGVSGFRVTRKGFQITSLDPDENEEPTY